MSEFPAELVKLQGLVLLAEDRYARYVAALHRHPLMVRARAEGRATEVAARLRDAARAA